MTLLNEDSSPSGAQASVCMRNRNLKLGKAKIGALVMAVFKLSKAFWGFHPNGKEKKWMHNFDKSSVKTC